MNRHYVRIFCACIVSVGVLGCSSIHADVGQLGQKAISAAWTGIQKVLPTKPLTIAALCVAGGITAKTLWTRYVTLRTIDGKINPEVALYADRRERPIYNWMVGTPGFTTPAQIRANHDNVKAALVTASLSGEVDIFQYGTGISLTAGHAVYWADVLSSIDDEIAHIRRWMRGLESFVGLSFRGIHLFGIRKNFADACDSLGITGLDQLRHALTVNQEEQIQETMTEDRGLGERIIALFMANPNYDKAYLVFWELDQRLGRLQAIKEAVMHSPVQWHIALH